MLLPSPPRVRIAHRKGRCTRITVEPTRSTGMTSRVHRTALLVLLTPALAGVAGAQGGGYRQPPAPIAAILDAPPTPLVSLSPDRSTMLLLPERDAHHRRGV